MEIHDGDGLRTTVFFKGCPLKCVWCHNPESIGFTEETAFFKSKCISCGGCGGEKSARTADLCPTGALIHYGKYYEPRELAEILLKDKAFFISSGGGVTFSGGECLMQADFLASVAELLKANGVSVYIDTCGYVKRESIERVLPLADKFLYDIKAIDPQVHKRCTGKDNAIILDNLRLLSAMGATVEVRYPLVVGMNEGEAQKIGAFLFGMRGVTGVKVLRYHALAKSRYEALGMESTLPDSITDLCNIAEAEKLIRAEGVNIIKD